ncbi:unnamed protein product [Zymoseptoria tritici ST99CH_3D7]|uniref:Uncharacterized protein n=1 Tax=Zymoseptoria tritici (strain ST99CH_3D7) TaxID=1276538 RepID=A0A1X7RNS2_ZYMT9|nr:unnamed protein product [Zymoseptoria tritici ST99CH_3D7]
MHLASLLPAMWIGSCLASNFVCYKKYDEFGKWRTDRKGRSEESSAYCDENNGCCLDTEDNSAEPAYYTCQKAFKCGEKNLGCVPNPSGYAVYLRERGNAPAHFTCQRTSKCGEEKG